MRALQKMTSAKMTKHEQGVIHCMRITGDPGCYHLPSNGAFSYPMANSSPREICSLATEKLLSHAYFLLYVHGY